VTKQILSSAAKYGLGIALLAYVLWTNWPGLTRALEEPLREQGLPLTLANVLSLIRVGPLTLAILFCLAGVLLTFVRWYLLVCAQGLPFTLSNAVRLGLIGYFLSTFLPGSIGGDLIKAAFIAREQSRRTVAVATVLIDRAIGLWGLVWLVALLGSAFWVHGALAGATETILQSIVLSAVGIVGFSLLVWVLLGVLPINAERFAGRLQRRIPKIGSALAEFWRAAWMYRCQGRAVGVALLLALIGHSGFVLTFYCAAQTLQDVHQLPSLPEHFLIVPIGAAIQAGMPTPGGIGVGEGSFGALYQLIGYVAAQGVLACLVQRMITWALGLVGYLVYLRMRPALRTSAPSVQSKSPAADAACECQEEAVGSGTQA
jgi:uncharacterized protein (TIRG00374 family)